MKKIGVVLLNYNGYEDTINCIKTLINQKNVNMSLVIVDNKSINDSYKILKDFVKEYEEKYDITVMSTNSNLGFARGNNVGIRFLRNDKNCDFVFILNNDTLVKDPYAIEKLMALYHEGVGVINPKCCDFDGVFQRPYRVSNGNMIKDYFQAIALTIWQIAKGIINVDYSIHKRKESNFNYNEYKYIIQGNAYILTPDFFKYYSQSFPGTFLYCEELFLLWYLQKANLSTVYDDNTTIWHKESGSVKSTTQKYKLSKGKNMLKSIVRGTPLLFMSMNGIQRKYNSII